jgi:hypothetical protein
LKVDWIEIELRTTSLDSSWAMAQQAMAAIIRAKIIENPFKNGLNLTFQ